MELRALPPGLRLEEAGPEGALELLLLRAEVVLDAGAAFPEGAAPSDEVVGGREGVQGEEHPGGGRLLAERRGVHDGDVGAWQP